jgi:hypothetical protein
VVEKLLEPKDSKQGNVQYWLCMERAYVLFVLSDYDKVKELYELYTEPKSKWKEWYMPYFRLGELYFIKGEIVKALEHFDTCEEILLKLDKDNKVAPLTYIIIESRLAQMYWLIGEQYYDVALSKVQKAEEIYKAHYDNILTDLRPRFERAIANNLCWFYLEIYILAKDKYEQSGDEEDYKIGEWAYGGGVKKIQRLRNANE